MNSILAFLAAHLGPSLAGLGIGAGLLLGKKFLPGIVRRIIGEKIVLLLNPHTDNPKEKKLIQNIILDLVKLAEYKIPDRGKGQERYLAVANTLAAYCPILHGQENKLEALIEAGVAAMDDELKKIADNLPPEAGR